VRYSAATATRLSGLRAKILKFYGIALHTSKSASVLLAQLASLGMGLYGVALLSVPAALITGAVVVITALELR
jgi:hypothetical protein